MKQNHKFSNARKPIEKEKKETGFQPQVEKSEPKEKKKAEPAIVTWPGPGAYDMLGRGSAMTLDKKLLKVGWKPEALKKNSTDAEARGPGTYNVNLI